MRFPYNFDHNQYKQKEVAIGAESPLENLRGHFEQVGGTKILLSQWQVVSIFWQVSGAYMN